jgi:glycosyltransferase involved in cell wall biosynthesis
MSELEQKANRLVVMLTADRQIDRRITLQADSLESYGWRVVIVGMPLDRGQDQDARVVRIGSEGYMARRENLVLSSYRWLRGYLPMNGPVMRCLKRMAWHYVVDPESFFTRVFLAGALRYSPRIFVAHDLPMLPVAAKAARACGARLVYDSHELYCEQEFSDREKRRWEEIESKYIGVCDVVITVNSSISTELERRYRVKGINVIYNAERKKVKRASVQTLHEILRLPTNKKILLFQGGISSGRNLNVLIEATGLVKNKSVVLLILGDGLLVRDLRKQAKRAACEDRVFFHSAVPQAKLLEMTSGADAGIIPYQPTCLNNLYCTPNKLFEFIAAEIPIVSTDLPEVTRIIKNYKIGLVGDTSTPHKFAKLLDDFFSSEERLSLWRKNCKGAKEAICWEEEEKKLLKIFNNF